MTKDALCYTENKEENNMKEILILVGLVAGWIVLMKYVLPKFGIST